MKKWAITHSLAHPQVGKWATKIPAIKPLLFPLAQMAQFFMTIETKMVTRVHMLHTKVV